MQPDFDGRSEQAWRDEVLSALQAMQGLLARLVEVAERPELPVERESAAVTEEPAENDEPLGTWILTDQVVQRVEEAIVQEQRVRGRAYGG